MIINFLGISPAPKIRMMFSWSIRARIFISMFISCTATSLCLRFGFSILIAISSLHVIPVYRIALLPLPRYFTSAISVASKSYDSKVRVVGSTF